FRAVRHRKGDAVSKERGKLLPDRKRRDRRKQIRVVQCQPKFLLDLREGEVPKRHGEPYSTLVRRPTTGASASAESTPIPGASAPPGTPRHGSTTATAAAACAATPASPRAVRRAAGPRRPACRTGRVSRPRCVPCPADSS